MWVDLIHEGCSNGSHRERSFIRKGKGSTVWCQLIIKSSHQNDSKLVAKVNRANSPKQNLHTCNLPCLLRHGLSNPIAFYDFSLTHLFMSLWNYQIPYKFVASTPSPNKMSHSGKASPFPFSGRYHRAIESVRYGPSLSILIFLWRLML